MTGSLSRMLGRAFAVGMSLAVSGSLARAQANPNAPVVSWNTYTQQSSAPSALDHPVACQGYSSGSTAASPVSLSGGCGISGIVTGQYITSCNSIGQCYTANANFDAGSFASTNAASADPNSGVSASASLSGYSGAGAFAETGSTAYFYDYISVSGPNDIANAVLTSAYTGTRSGSASVVASLFANSLTSTGALGPTFCNPNCLEANGVTADGIQHALTLTIPWGLVTTNMFAYSLEAQSNEGLANGTPQSASGSVFVSTPTFALFDANGNDVTSEHTITFDPGGTIDAQPPVTSTPEPASIVLFGTGIAGLGGIKLRRRAKA